jgi:hypothetical protein
MSCFLKLFEKVNIENGCVIQWPLCWSLWCICKLSLERRLAQIIFWGSRWNVNSFSGKLWCTNTKSGNVTVSFKDNVSTLVPRKQILSIRSHPIWSNLVNRHLFIWIYCEDWCWWFGRKRSCKVVKWRPEQNYAPFQSFLSTGRPFQQTPPKIIKPLMFWLFCSFSTLCPLN